MSETSLNNQAFRGKVLKDPQEAWQLFDLIRKISADTASNKVVNTEEYVKVLQQILNDTFVVYIFEEVPTPQEKPSNDVGNIYDVGIASDGSIWFKKLSGWELVFKPLPRFKAYKLESEDTNTFPEANNGDLVFTLKGRVYQREESGWVNIHTPIELRIRGVISHESLIPTFGNDNDIAIDKALKFYQKQDGVWVEILTLNTYTKEEINSQLQGLLDVIGDLGDLETSDQSSIVNAINEVLEIVQNLTDEDIALSNVYPYLGLDITNNQDDFNQAIVTKVVELDEYAHQLINDSLDTGTENTWSISRIVQSLEQLRDSIIGNCSGTPPTDFINQDVLRFKFTAPFGSSTNSQVIISEIEYIPTGFKAVLYNTTLGTTYTEDPQDSILVVDTGFVYQDLRDIIQQVYDIVESGSPGSVPPVGLWGVDESLNLVYVPNSSEFVVMTTTGAPRLTIRYQRFENGVSVTGGPWNTGRIIDLDYTSVGDGPQTPYTLLTTLCLVSQEIHDIKERLGTVEIEQAKRVAVNQSQEFTEPEKQQGRDNLDILSRQEVDDAISELADNSVSYVVDQSTSKTELEKQIARSNIDVHNREYVDDALTDIYDKIGNINVLDPDIDQTGLAEAIQSVFEDVVALRDYAENLIDDTAGTGVTDKTYSANQILDLLLHLKNEILGGAGPAFDTLLELQQAIQDNDIDITTLLTEQAKRVSAGHSQSFTSGEQQIARTNINVYSQQEIDTLILDAVTDIMNQLAKRVAVDQVQNLSEAEKLQGRQNIDVYSTSEIGDITTDLAAYFTQQINNL